MGKNKTNIVIAFLFSQVISNKPVNIGFPVDQWIDFCGKFFVERRVWNADDADLYDFQINKEKS